VLIWNTLTGGKTKIIEPKNRIFSLCWSPTGKYLALGSYGVNVIKVQDWSEVGGIPGGLEIVMSLAWSPDGSSIAIGRSDQRLSLVRVPWKD
jgi:WD40 repeat protein